MRLCENDLMKGHSLARSIQLSSQSLIIKQCYMAINIKKRCFLPCPLETIALSVVTGVMEERRGNFTRTDHAVVQFMLLGTLSRGMLSCASTEFLAQPGETLWRKGMECVGVSRVSSFQS